MNITLRNYTKADYLALKAVLDESELLVDAWDTNERLAKRVDEKPESIIVAVNDNSLIGCIYVVDDIIPMIFRLAVKKGYRKQGIGKLLMNEAIKRIKDHGHTEVAIFVHEENKELKNWYTKQGFEQFSLLRCMVKEL